MIIVKAAIWTVRGWVSIKNNLKGNLNMSNTWGEDDLPDGLFGDICKPDKPWWEYYSDEELDAIIKEDIKKEFNRKRNIRRDEKGRLNKGAKLAKKDACNEQKIIMWLRMGFSVKEIVEALGCSKSTVYRVKKQYEEKKRTLIDEVPKVTKIVTWGK